MTPVEALGRLAAIVPPPRYPLLRFHGVLAPRHRWRDRVVPRPPARAPVCKGKGEPSELGPAETTLAATPARPSPRALEAGDGRAAFVLPAATLATATLTTTGAAVHARAERPVDRPLGPHPRGGAPRIELQARLAHPPEANLRRRPSRLRAMRGQAHRTRDGHGTGLRRQDARRAPPPARPARGRLIPIDRPRDTSRLGAAAPRAPHNPPRFQPPWKSAHPRTRPARSFPPFSAEIP